MGENINKKQVREWVKSFPLPLLDLKDKKLIAYANSFLPYETGIEIECPWKRYLDLSTYSMNHERENELPFLLEIDNDNEEKRFRIHKGIEGLVCLYAISEFLKEYCLLNPRSGNHYHIDFNEMRNKIPFQGGSISPYVQHNSYDVYANRMFIEENQEWILNSLEKWNYRGNFNDWSISSLSSVALFRLRLGSFEIRIGEMTFDYDLLVKRINQAQILSWKIKQKMLNYGPNNSNT